MSAPTAKQRERMQMGWRLVGHDFRSTHGYRWPYPGNWAVAPGPIVTDNIGPCPGDIGDGLCVAKTARGATSGGAILGRTVGLIIGWLPEDVLGEDDNKLRVRRAWVEDTMDPIPWLLERRADLRNADLRGADLRGANLRGADLGEANLGGANLRNAYLRNADLWGANLGDADLRGANLWGANLGDADLRDADLRDAYLGEANLRGADLRGANLRNAYLRNATYTQLTLWPDGFDPAGAVSAP